MDKILSALQNKAFFLNEFIYRFLSDKYNKLTEEVIPDLQIKSIHPGLSREIINKHREQFFTDEYLSSRIQNPTSGTLDHLHAEITSTAAVKLGKSYGLNKYGVELLRIAGHLHDSDRSFPAKTVCGEEESRRDAELYKEFKKLHADNSSIISFELVKKINKEGFYSTTGFAKDLIYLIKRHEVGGNKKEGINIITPSKEEPELNLNDLADIITDADSLSYFDANILTNWEECGKDKRILDNKIHFMFDRMSLKAKNELRKTILFSKGHILGKDSGNKDIKDIRKILLQICR